MRILDTDVTKFQELYKKHFNIKLDKIEARDKLSKLVRQMEIVYQPITLQQLERLIEKDNKTKKH